MSIQAYLFFDGRCEEALEFYKKTLGAQVEMLMRFSESPEGSPMQLPPDSGNKIMHSSFRVGDTVLMASDGYCGGKPSFTGFALSVTASDEADARKRFAALADGGQITTPLAPTFWSPLFGMLTDRFGVMWMVGVEH